MSDEYGDTGESPTEDSQASGSEAEDSSQDTGDTGSGSEADAGPVPYERFKESRSQLSDSKERSAQLEQQVMALQSQQQESAQWNRWAWEKLQQKEASPAVQEEDVYADPLEAKVKKLEGLVVQQQQFHDHRYQEMQVAQAEREILSELDSARQKYPEMRDADVVNALTQNPNASVLSLAKRSHESEISGFENKLKRRGYKPKPKALQKGRGSVPVKMDFGDDMEAAEAAAIAALSGE